MPAHVNSPLLQTRIISWTKFKYAFFLACFSTHKLQLIPQKILKILLTVYHHLLTDEVSSEIVLNLNIVVIFPSIFINKYSLEVVREKPSVGSQVKFEMSSVKRKMKIVLNCHQGTENVNINK